MTALWLQDRFKGSLPKLFLDPQPYFGIVIPAPTKGELAQLGERVTGSHEVRGSNPLFSTTHDGRRRLPSPFLCIWAHGATVSAGDS